MNTNREPKNAQRRESPFFKKHICLRRIENERLKHDQAEALIKFYQKALSNET